MLVYAACRRAVAYSTCGGAKGRGQAAAYMREWLKYKGDADFVYASALGLETWLVYTRLLRVYIGDMDGPLAIEAQS